MADDERVYRAQIAADIAAILNETGWSAARLAREIEVSGSTITRALDPEATNLLSARTLNKLKRLVPSAAYNFHVRESNSTLDASNIDHARQHITKATVPVVGYIHDEVNYPAGAYLEEEPLNIRVAEYGDAPLFAFRVRGGASDRALDDGDYVLASPIGPGSVVFEGDIIVVRRENGADFLETILMDVFSDGKKLLAETRDPEEKFRRVYELDTEYNAALSVLGVVVAIYAVRKRRFGLPLVLPEHLITDGAWRDAAEKRAR